jgi:hypothetical protein
VRDHNGQVLAHVYFEDESGRPLAAKLLTKDEARRIASNIAKLPDLLQCQQSGARRRKIGAAEMRRGAILDWQLAPRAGFACYRVQAFMKA